MQVWSQVKVTAHGPNEGLAGLVIRVEDGVNLVRLDLQPEPAPPVGFLDSELEFLA